MTGQRLGCRNASRLAQALATGWVAKEIAATLSPPPGATERYRKAFLAANDAKSEPGQIVRAIVSMIQEFAKLTTEGARQPAKRGK